jgi:hypothetical protein
MRRSIVVLLGLALAWGIMLLDNPVLAQDAAVEKTLAAPLPPVASCRDKPALEVRGLDEPQNPYREQYGEWDRWLFEHPGEPDETQAAELRMDRLPENWVCESVMVDDYGYPIPVLVSLHNELRQIAAGKHPIDKDSYRYEAWGEMPLELWHEYHAAELRVYAQYISVIPAWLAENPPLVARIWTDGSVTTHGPLGSWNGEGDVVPMEDGGWTHLSDPYYRYSPDGVLLCQTAWDDWEQNVFTGSFNSADPLQGLFYTGWADQVFWHSRACGWRGPGIMNGYWVFYNKKTRQRLVIYDLDGTCLPADFDVNARNANKFDRILGGSLKQLRQYQLELGLATE